MKNIFMILAAIIACNNIYGQVIQNGQVYLQNSGSKPLSGVQIMVAGAPPASSDDIGCFKLDLPKGKVGEMLLPHKIYKKGYEIVNEEHLKRWIISPQRKLVIELCPEGSLAEAKMRYYNIGRSNNLTQYNKAVEELNQLKESKKIEEQKYEEELHNIGDEYRNAMEHINTYSLRLAQINKDNLSDIEKRAMDFIEKGEVAQAIAVFQEAKTIETFNLLTAQSEKVEDNIDKMVISLRQYSDICLFAGGKENFNKAGEILRTIAMSDTTNYDYCNDYMDFLISVELDFKNAYQWSCRALNASKNDMQRIEAKSYMFAIDISNNKFDNTEMEYPKLKAELAICSADSLFINEAICSLNAFYSRYLIAKCKFKEAATVNAESINAAYALCQDNAEKYILAFGAIICDYASILYEQGLYDKCIKVSNIAIKTLSNIPGKDATAAILYRNGALTTKAVSQYKNGDYSGAMAACNDAINASLKNYELHPVKFATSLLEAALASTNIYVAVGNHSVAVEKLKNAIDVYEKSIPNTSSNGYTQALYILCKQARNSDIQLPMEYYDKAIMYNENLVKQGYQQYSPLNRTAICYIHKIERILPSSEIAEMYQKKGEEINQATIVKINEAERIITQYIDCIYQYREGNQGITLDNIDHIGYFMAMLYAIHSFPKQKMSSNVSKLSIAHKSYLNKTEDSKKHHCNMMLEMRKITKTK